jgi:Flp pilus assembly protein TadD
LALGLILPLVLVAYLAGFRGAFVLDDLSLIVHNPHLRSLGPLHSLVNDSRPLLTLSLQLTYQLALALTGDGLDVRAYHAVNLLIHAAAAGVLFLLLCDLLQLPALRKWNPDESPRRAWEPAVVVAVLWAVHPLNTQAVTYIIQRGESLMGLCYLLALWTWLRSRLASSPQRRWSFTLGCIFAVLAGLGSKQVMVTAPLMILVFDRVLFADSFVASLRKQGLLFVIAAAAAAHVVYHNLVPAGSPGSVASAGFAMPLMSPLEYLWAQPPVILHYLRLSIAPVGLTFDYGWNPAHLAVWWQWTSAVIVVALVAFTVLGVCRQQPWALPGAWFLGILSITSSFIPIADVAAEHRMYLPLIAVIVAVVLVVNRHVIRMIPAPPSGRMGIVTALVVAASVGLVGLTGARNRLYADPVALWRDTTQRAPHNPRAWHNLGYVLHQAGNHRAAAAAFARSLELEPDDAETRVNLGVALKASGQRDEAIAQFTQALALHSDSAAALNQLGIIAVQEGKLEQAIGLFTQAVRSDPKFADAQMNLANAHLEHGDFFDAIEHYRAALALQPADANLHNLLGIALARGGDLPGAAAAFGEALRVNPHHADAAANLARAQDMLDATRHPQTH